MSKLGRHPFVRWTVMGKARTACARCGLVRSNPVHR